MTRVICGYENQPLSTSSTHAVPRLLAQLVERLASEDSSTEFLAISPGGSSLAGVRNLTAELDPLGKLRCRLTNNRVVRKLRPANLEASIAVQRFRATLQQVSHQASDSTIVIAATMTVVNVTKQIMPNARVIYWVQGMPRLGQEAYASRAVNLADAIVAPSRALYQDLFQLVCRDRFAPPVWMIPNSIDRSQFKPESADAILATRQRLGIADDQIAIMHIGRAPEKGLQVIQAALATGNFTKKLVLVSAGSATKRRRQLAERTEVIEVGRVTPGELNQIYQACNFGVVPSVWWENCPLALIEMMSLGLCPIGSRVGGIPEMIEHGETGLIVDSPNDAQAWADAIETLSTNDSLRQTMADQAKRTTPAKFDQERSLSKWREVLKTVSGI
jgi:glycosyltransferase involved in cell wall biosynthesis